jgi:hypothetical protein
MGKTGLFLYLAWSCADGGAMLELNRHRDVRDWNRWLFMSQLVTCLQAS